jgi:hypothetical protein
VVLFTVVSHHRFVRVSLEGAVGPASGTSHTWKLQVPSRLPSSHNAGTQEAAQPEGDALGFSRPLSLSWYSCFQGRSWVSFPLPNVMVGMTTALFPFCGPWLVYFWSNSCSSNRYPENWLIWVGKGADKWETQFFFLGLGTN